MAQLVQSPPQPPILPRKLGDVIIDSFFQYIITVTFVNLDNQQKVIQIQSDAHFLCVSSYYNSSLQSGVNWQGSGLNRGGSLVQLIDGGAGQRMLQSAQVPANTLFGSAQRPFIWPFRHIFHANTNLTLNVTDTSGTAQVVDYVFGGFKIPLGSTGGLLP